MRRIDVRKTTATALLAVTFTFHAFLGVGLAAEPAVLTLEQAVAFAQNQSPSVQQAKLALDSAQAGLDAATSALRPSAAIQVGGQAVPAAKKFAAGGSISVTVPLGTALSFKADASPAIDNSSGNRGSGAASTPELSLSGDWQLWPPSAVSKTASSIQSARVAVDAAQANLNLARRQAQLQITQAYKDLQIDARRTALAEDAAQAAAQARVQAETLAKQGSLSQLDLLDARAKAASAASSEQSAKDKYRADLVAFAQQLGIDADTLSLSPWQPTAFDPVTPNREQLVSDALAHDTKVESARQSLARATQQLQAARTQNGFTVSTGAQLSWAQLSGDPEFVASVSASYPLLDGGAKAAAVRQAQDSVASADAALAQAEAQLAVAIDGQIAALKEQALKIAALQLASDKARLQAQQAPKQQSSGLITNEQRADLERAALSAALDLDAAIVAYNAQAAELRATPGR